MKFTAREISYATIVNRVQLAISPMICMNASKVYTVLWVYSVMTNYCSERLEEAFVCINFLSKKDISYMWHCWGMPFACQINKKIRMKIEKTKIKSNKVHPLCGSTSNNEKCIITAQE